MDILFVVLLIRERLVMVLMMVLFLISVMLLVVESFLRMGRISWGVSGRWELLSCVYFVFVRWF